MLRESLLNRRTRHREQPIRQRSEGLKFFRRTAHIVSMIAPLALLMATLSAQSQPPTPSGSDSSQKQQQQSNAQKENTAVSPSTTPANATSVQQPQVPPPTSKPSANTNEQKAETALDWWLKVSSSVSNVVIALVTIALALVAIFQAKYMRDGLAETRKAATAAVSAAETAEQTLYLTQRAFISADLVPTIIGHPQTQQPYRWEIRIKWKNSGSTPAHPIRSWVSGEPINPSDIDMFQFPPLADGLTPHGLPPIARGDHRTSDAVKISIDDLNAIKTNAKALMICGYVEYKDQFFPKTPMHHTQVCVRAEVVTDPGSKTVHPFGLVSYPKYNEST